MARVAIVLGEGFEDDEFRVPYDRLREAGHVVTLVGTRRNSFVIGKNGREKVGIGATPAELRAADFDAVVIPGGHGPDAIRTDPDIVAFIRDFGRSGLPVAAVCHGPSLLIEADLVRDRRVTSWPSIRTDLINAGARWEDDAVVVDGNLVTSRKPADLTAFTQAILDRLAIRAPEPA